MIEKKNIIYLTGGFIIFIAVIFSFAISPFLLKIARNSEDIIIKKRNLDYLSERSREYNNELGELNEIIARMENFFIDPVRPINQILFLRQAAAENNLEMEMNIARPRDAGNEMWPHLNFRISLRGRSTDFFAFLEKIETAEWFAIIEVLNIRKMTERDLRTGESEIINNRIIADMTIKVYFRE